MRESEFPIGHLVISMYVQVPDSHNKLIAKSKKVNLVSFPCEWSQRHELFERFKAMNSSIDPDQLGGEFILRDYM